MVCCVTTQLFSRGGHSVCVYDIDLKQLQTAQTSIRQQLKKLQEEGLLRTSQTAEELAHAMTFTSDFKEAVKNALHIQVYVNVCPPPPPPPPPSCER